MIKESASPAKHARVYAESSPAPGPCHATMGGFGRLWEAMGGFGRSFWAGPRVEPRLAPRLPVLLCCNVGLWCNNTLARVGGSTKAWLSRRTLIHDHV